MNTTTEETTEQREARLEEQAWQEIEEAGYTREAVEDYRDNMGDYYCPLFREDDGEPVMLWGDWIDQFEEAFTGYSDTEDFAAELAEEFLSGAPEFLVRYFDYKMWERDLFLGDYWQGTNGYIFRSY
jgi:hypothetical protein